MLQALKGWSHFPLHCKLKIGFLSSFEDPRGVCVCGMVSSSLLTSQQVHIQWRLGFKTFYTHTHTSPVPLRSDRARECLADIGSISDQKQHYTLKCRRKRGRGRKVKRCVEIKGLSLSVSLRAFECSRHDRDHGHGVCHVAAQGQACLKSHTHLFLTLPFSLALSCFCKSESCISAGQWDRCSNGLCMYRFLLRCLIVSVLSFVA